MAHHLAELIDRAGNGSSASEQATARKIATETILQIWKYRGSLPGKAYPLAPYRNVLKVLDVLRPVDGLPQYFRPNLAEKKDQLAARLFDGFSRLIIALLFSKVCSKVRSRENPTVVFKSLSKEEQKVLKTLLKWDELFLPTATNSPRTRNKSKIVSTTTTNLNQVTLQLINEISSALGELRNELPELGSTTQQLGIRKPQNI